LHRGHFGFLRQVLHARPIWERYRPDEGEIELEAELAEAAPDLAGGPSTAAEYRPERGFAGTPKVQRATA
jgi:hypothetical protein